MNAVWSLLQNLYEENIIITLLSCQNRRKGEKKVLSAFLKPHFNPKRVLFVLAFSPTKLASPISTTTATAAHPAMHSAKPELQPLFPFSSDFGKSNVES